MKAALYERTGPAREVLEVGDRQDPQPEDGEVRVRVHVSGVNPTDVKARLNGSPLLPRQEDGRLPWPEQIPNQDGSGVIDAVGAGVDPGRVGQRVWVYHAAAARPSGTAADYVCLPERQVVPLPDGCSFEQGAGLGVPYITAHRSLFADGPIDGATVLVTGGAGAVGNAAIQFARWGGATRVVATVSSEDKAALARSAGADATVNYRTVDVTGQLRAAAPDGFDRVVDVALETNLASYADVLAHHAVCASYASTPAPTVTLPLQRLRAVNATIRGLLVYNLTQPMLDAAVADITTALEAAAFYPLPAIEFPLEQIVAAHEAVERGAVGKVLVHLV